MILLLRAPIIVAIPVHCRPRVCCVGDVVAVATGKQAVRVRVGSIRDATPHRDYAVAGAIRLPQSLVAVAGAVAPPVVTSAAKHARVVAVLLPGGRVVVHTRHPGRVTTPKVRVDLQVPFEALKALWRSVSPSVKQAFHDYARSQTTILAAHLRVS